MKRGDRVAIGLALGFSIIAVIVAAIAVRKESSQDNRHYSFVVTNGNAEPTLYVAPDPSSEVIKVLGGDDEIMMLCWIDTVEHNGTVRWFKVKVRKGGEEGFISANYVANQKVVPMCQALG